MKTYIIPEMETMEVNVKNTLLLVSPNDAVPNGGTENQFSKELLINDEEENFEW